ncbi:GPW/gp25 family protein [Aquimarina longa]|uniref:GPW/gp25 family protein n=1 Tax=Aquimarina longa TaxID=1080221 RepID=UPI000782CD53|nr:GPW/gp25 family protein [Aquimarina longa]
MSISNSIEKRWSFPPKFDNRSGQIELVGDIDAIAQNLEIIVNTRLGERVLRSQFGSRTHELLFESITENMKTYMTQSLKESIELNEPRIDITDMRIDQPDVTIGKLSIHIVFEVIATKESQNLVLPYYLPNISL